MKKIQPNKNITLNELQERVKYVFSFKSRLEKLRSANPKQGVEIARSIRRFINAEDKELTKKKYDDLMNNNKYLSNYKGFILEFRQFNGRITQENLHSFIFEITSAHSSSEMKVFFPDGNI
ncbi:hypothetical protein [Lactobacillus hominis]|uniref:hypothetical protein n=1 Tax=Lactobacillus hominis TaxID=1203033 RepID=UPI0023F18460|nr:hypothetical protein [Lactobacillus hominis]